MFNACERFTAKIINNNYAYAYTLKIDPFIKPEGV